MTARRTLVAAIGALGVALAGTLAVAAPAAAHNVVVGTVPGTGETVTQAPSTVEVTFDDVVLELSAEGSSTVVSVTDADGVQHATGCPTTQDRTVSVPVALGAAGEYTVDWRIVSADGHPTSGEFSFTYAPPEGAAEAPATTAPAGEETGCGAPASAADEAGSAAQGAADDPADRGTGAGASEPAVVLGIAGGVVVLAGAAVLVALRVARRRG
ncbi:copper resistance protein CopC [Isoptericola sp. 4D.3]|uniref:Copper resistance protein CopC n=1 Tax=Isoptericola peretonis TaxID=2918523 RepID=A0ABT0J2A8_9MICO|nr:copper resistance protein CopC [Isoptericola sp. 4D.3]